jgi:hypothetical protein
MKVRLYRWLEKGKSLERARRKAPDPPEADSGAAQHRIEAHSSRKKVGFNFFATSGFDKPRRETLLSTGHKTLIFGKREVSFCHLRMGVPNEQSAHGSVLTCEVIVDGR